MLSTLFKKSPIKAMVSVLRKFGANSHLYLPGSGTPILGPDLIINGDFSQGTSNWTTSNGWVISDGKATKGGTGSAGNISQSLNLSGKLLEITFTVSNRTAGSIAAVLVESGVSTTSFNTAGNGTFKTTLTRPLADAFRFTADGVFDGSVDNVVVREILGYSNIFSGISLGNYLDSSGTTNAGVDNNVGLILDATGEVGIELMPSYDMTSASWSSIGTPTLITTNGFTNASGTTAGLVISAASLGLSQNTSYLISIPYTKSESTSTISARIQVGIDLASSVSSTGVLTGIALAGTSGLQLRYTNNGTVSFGKISIKQVSGIHPVQSTTGYQPKLRRGIVNVIAYSGDFTQNNWGKINMTVSGELLSRTNIGSPSYTTHGVPAGTIPVGATYTVAAKVKVGTQDQFIGIRAQGSYPTRVDVKVNLVDGTFTTSNNTYPPATSITVAGPDDQGYYLVSIIGVTSGTELQAAVIGPTASAIGVASWESASSTACDCRVQNVLVAAGAYTAQDILAAGGIPLTATAPTSSMYGPYYHEFDSIDDYLSIPTIPFQLADDYVIAAAVRFKNIGADRFVYSQRNIGNSIPLVGLRVSSGRAVEGWCRNDLSETATAIAPAIAVSGSAAVISTRKLSGWVTARHNSQGSAPIAAPIGACTLTNAVIGGSLTTTNTQFFGSGMYGLVLIKGAVSDADLLIIERGLNMISGYIAKRF